MVNFFLVFLGGGLGSICRYGIARIITNHLDPFPFATFIANVLSCILLGFLVGLSLKGTMNQNYKLLLITGFCGGFSTFFTFSNETFHLFQSGNVAYAMANIGASLLVCLFCIYLGLKLT